MSTVWCKKWWTVLGHLVSGARFDCFDTVNTGNKKKITPFQELELCGFEFSLGQQNVWNKLNNVLFAEHAEHEEPQFGTEPCRVQEDKPDKPESASDRAC